MRPIQGGCRSQPSQDRYASQGRTTMTRSAQHAAIQHSPLTAHHSSTHDSVALDRPTACSGVLGLLSGLTSLTSSTTTFSATTGVLFLADTGTAMGFFSGWAVAFFETTRRRSGVSSEGAYELILFRRMTSAVRTAATHRQWRGRRQQRPQRSRRQKWLCLSAPTSIISAHPMMILLLLTDDVEVTWSVDMASGPLDRSTAHARASVHKFDPART